MTGGSGRPVKAETTEGKIFIVAIGEILWDMLPGGRLLGGAPANFIYYLHTLGMDDLEGVLVSRVGKDAAGAEILSRWKALGLRSDHISEDASRPTGMAGARVDAQGAPTFEIREPSAWDFLPETYELHELARRADAVCFGTLAQRAPVSRATIRAFLGNLRPGALRLFDVNLRAPFYSPEVFKDSLRYANALKTNVEEFGWIRKTLNLPSREEQAVREMIRRYNLRLAAVTKGHEGSALYTRKETSLHTGFSVPVADTIGAGDAFSAALTAGMLARFSLDELNKFANRAAADACRRQGAIPG